MSNGNDYVTPGGPGSPAKTESGTVEAAKTEAAEVTHTAADAAKDVSHVAMDEAGAVMDEAKHQIRDLYEQTRTELTEEASKQQERVASGLQDVGEDLGSMARNAERQSLATELVRETSQRVGRVAEWLGDREPGAVLDEVKDFARRKPGVFIGAAAVAGVLAGRLTWALSSEGDSPSGGARPTRSPERAVPAAASAEPPVPPVAGRPTSIVTAGGAAGAAGGTAGAAGPAGTEGAHAAPSPLPGTADDPLTETETPQNPLPPRTGSGGDLNRREGTDDRPHTL